MEIFLTIILFVMIGGYFSIAEERTVNQVFKVISRVGMVGGVFYLLHILRRFGHVTTVRYENILAPIFYLLYLLLGFASFMWSSDFRYSALQWFMTFESLVFVWLFLKVLAFD